MPLRTTITALLSLLLALSPVESGAFPRDTDPDEQNLLIDRMARLYGLDHAREAVMEDPYYSRIFAPRDLPPEYDCSWEEGLAGIEDLYGPGNVYGISGNSALTAGFASTGELTVLRWPSPSYFDQICYLTPFLTNSCELRKLPHHGALDNMGSFAGLYVELAGGGGRMTWFRDADWNHDQRYRTDESNVLVTRSTAPSLGLNLETLNFVPPDRDVLVRRYHITRNPGSPVNHARFVYFENMEPAVDKIPYLPISDWALDLINDFALLYTAEGDALVHFRPQRKNPLPLPGGNATQEEVDRFVMQLDEVYPFDEGLDKTPVFIAIGMDTASDDHQCGLQAVMDQGGPRPACPFYDAADGTLGNSSAAHGRCSGALAVDLMTGFDEAAFTVFIAADGTATGALDLLDAARADGFDRLLERTEAHWSDWLAGAALPDTQDPDILSVSKRCLITLKNGFDPRTGAFVASITTQPPYAVNWTRDGVYFAYALDLAGYPEMAEANMRFYAAVQRRCDDPDDPRYDVFCALEPLFRPFLGWRFDGTYEMAYYADGVPGGPIFFEIDNAGFAAWMMNEHATFLGPGEGSAYLCGDPDDAHEGGIYPAIRRTADSLAACRRPWNDDGLPCWAFEDDMIFLSRTLTGAITVYMGIRAAVEAGEICGESEKILQGWRDRLAELEEAIRVHFWDEAGGGFAGGAGPYMIWPAEFPFQGEELALHAARLFDNAASVLRKETRGGSYVAKSILSLARAGWDTGERGNDLAWAIDVLAKEVAAPGTGHYGEGYIIADIDGDVDLEFDNRAAIPHLWEATLFYLSAMAYYGSDRQETGCGDCGCSIAQTERSLPEGGRGLSVNILLMAAVLLWTVRLRRRAGKR